jgi:hypothetical protein
LQIFLNHLYFKEGVQTNDDFENLRAGKDERNIVTPLGIIL